MRLDVRPTSPGRYRASDYFDMSGEPSTPCRRSARLAAKRAEVKRVYEDVATPSRSSVEADAFATTTGCQSTFKKRNVTPKSTRLAQPAKKLKAIQKQEVGEITRTRRQDRTHRVSRHLEDVETPERGRKTTALAETSLKRAAVATKSPATAKKRRARAERASSEPSGQTMRMSGRSRSTSCSSEATQGVSSSSGSYHTAEDIARDTDSTTPEEEDDALPTPPVRQSKFDRFRRVWRWLVGNDDAQRGGRNEL
ncbi:hypothetical protein HPB52_010240 [Rhipicephalus sanguineus]|uniref:Uncharacterized protein n=1 Tax=Rhipicephalus sanguineus TaxID=34632 RepID=A0A9D4T997_RHISA|nr:hypothetical protein HPB52_010240 [Rhipicephalus sanguineus]